MGVRLFLSWFSAYTECSSIPGFACSLWSVIWRGNREDACETCLTLGAGGLKPVFWEVMEQSRAWRRWWTECWHSACSSSPASATSASAALRTAACQAPQSKGFSRQGYWSGLPCASPWIIPNPGIEPVRPVWQVNCLPLSHWVSQKKVTVITGVVVLMV